MRRPFNLLEPINASMESIEFQSNDFFDVLTSLFKEAREQGNTPAVVRKLKKDFSEAVKHFTNMNIDFDIKKEAYFDAAAYIGPAHITFFFDEYLKGKIDQKELGKKARETYIGGVDQKTGKVHGAFTKLRASVETTTGAIFGNKLEPDEIAAIMLHEIGHVFTILFLTASYTHGFQAIRHVVNKSVGVEITGDRAVILKRACQSVTDERIDDKDIEAALKADYAANNGEYPGTVALIMRYTQDDIDRQVGYATEYTGRVFEQMADEYASRYGAAKSLATGLDKLIDNSSRRNLQGFFIRGSRLVGSILSLAGLFFAPAGLAIPGIIVGIVTLFSAFVSAWVGSPVYDTARTRIDKMLQQLSAKSKEKNISVEERKVLIEEYNVIKSVRDKMSDSESYMDNIVAFLVPAFKRGRNFSAAMAEIEKLASNELYIKSQKFRTA